MTSPAHHERTSTWQALGLSLRNEAVDKVDFVGQRREVGAIWPFTLVVQLCAVAIVVIAAFLTERVPFMLRVSEIGGVILGLSFTALMLLRLPICRSWPAYRHNWAAIVYCGGIAAGLVALIWQASRLPLDRSQLVCVVAGLGALVGTAMAIHPMRAATFAFATALVAMIVILVGPGTSSTIAGICLLTLLLATRRVAQQDVIRTLQVTTEYHEGELAARLVHEFESNGTGWFWQTDREGCLTYLTQKVANAICDPGQSPVGRPLTAVFQMDNTAPGTERTLSFHMSSRTGFSDYTVRGAAASGADRWWSISGRPVIDDTGRFQGFVGSGADLTEKRRAEAEITRLALFDGLTGLANRQRMRASLEQTLNQPVGPYRPTTLFLLDLDRFKVVNDTLGHQTGDILLKQVAQRLLRAVGDAGLVGRLGGDEFQVVLPSENDPERLSDLARTIINALSHPYSIDGNTVTIGCSIGVAIAPQDGKDPETLVRNADLALYAAKADGRGIHRFYREELLHGAQNRKRLEDDLRHALVQNEFQLVYQPVVSTESARIVGYEALIRWEHPLRGAISPADFIPVAEDCGLIETIGEWVLRTACLEAAKWPSNVRVGVNVSPIQFANPALPAIITNAIAKAGIAASQLELEITESVFLNENQSTDAMFKSLKGIGVRLALDDFGTGYSSLGYLKSAPFDKIKIDQSFVRGAAIKGSRNAAIIKAIVTLAGSLGMETTAEGVETQDEIELIRELGCSHIQGYVYGKPARAEFVLDALVKGEGAATISGYRVSRAPRTKLFRTATLEVAGERGEVRIRDISSTGAMIDGIEFGRNPQEVTLLIELLEGQMFPARVRWAKDGRAGIEFQDRFNVARLNSSEGMKVKKAS
ncbi:MULTISPECIES: EAL domain-containing protein [Sphingomonas]|uniref:EAL domain-containing protein n=1 Tax=Sphingomonas TaxID=13687 RepID=UPI000A54A38B|nr:EAL domain-containing protein [Sphingomonas sp. CCH10-B3]